MKCVALERDGNVCTKTKSSATCPVPAGSILLLYWCSERTKDKGIVGHGAIYTKTIYASLFGTLHSPGPATAATGVSSSIPYNRLSCFVDP